MVQGRPSRGSRPRPETEATSRRSGRPVPSSSILPCFLGDADLDGPRVRHLDSPRVRRRPRAATSAGCHRSARAAAVARAATTLCARSGLAAGVANRSCPRRRDHPDDPRPGDRNAAGRSPDRRSSGDRDRHRAVRVAAPDRDRVRGRRRRHHPPAGRRPVSRDCCPSGSSSWSSTRRRTRSWSGSAAGPLRSGMFRLPSPCCRPGLWERPPCGSSEAGFASSRERPGGNRPRPGPDRFGG